MKNKKNILIITCILTCSFLYSLELSEFSLEPEFGFFNGTIIENVWNASMNNSGSTTTYTPTTKLSRLDWQLQNTPYLGIDIQTLFNEKYLLDFYFLNCISRACGIMEDYDWVIESQPDHLTNYSIHTNYLESYLNFNFYFGYVFALDTKFPITITPKFGFDFYNFDFTGRGGYRMYEDDNWEKVYFSDSVVIEYKQSYLAPHLAVSSDFDFTKHFESSLELGITYIKEYNAFDLHDVKHTYYNDRFKNAWAFNGQLELFFKINEMHKIGLKGTVDYMPDVYGFTYYSNTTPSNFPTTPMAVSLGGTSRLLWKYAVTYTITL